MLQNPLMGNGAHAGLFIGNYNKQFLSTEQLNLGCTEAENQLSPLRINNTIAVRKERNMIMMSPMMIFFMVFSLGIGFLLSGQAQVKVQISKGATIKDTPQVIIAN